MLKRWHGLLHDHRPVFFECVTTLVLRSKQTTGSFASRCVCYGNATFPCWFLLFAMLSLHAVHCFCRTPCKSDDINRHVCGPGGLNGSAACNLRAAYNRTSPITPILHIGIHRGLPLQCSGICRGRIITGLLEIWRHFFYFGQAGPCTAMESYMKMGGCLRGIGLPTVGVSREEALTWPRLPLPPVFLGCGGIAPAPQATKVLGSAHMEAD